MEYSLKGNTMRHGFVVVLLALALFSTGCDGGHGESNVKNSLETMKELTAAFEQGDKERILTVAKKLQALIKERKEMKISESEQKLIQEKYESQGQEQVKKMMAAMLKAIQSGKLKEVDAQEIGTIIKQTK